MKPQAILPVLWSDQAKAEFYKAEQWYAEISLQLSSTFVQAVEDAIERIAEFPQLFPIVRRERRRAGVMRFPHGSFTRLRRNAFL